MLFNGTLQEIWHAVFSLTVSALFVYAWSLGDEQYFTTWALFIYAGYFLTSAIMGFLEYVGFRCVKNFVSNGQFARWIFAPCLIVSVSVAVTVLFMLFESWSRAWNLHCEGKSAECRDLILSFVVSHYLPPVALLLSSVTDDKLILHPTTQKKEKERNSWRTLGYVVILYQLAMIPNMLYGTFYDPKNVYGTSRSSTYSLYAATGLAMSFTWGYSRGE